MAVDAGGDDYEAVWRRVEDVGGFVPVGAVGRVGETGVEVVKTYADSTLTAVFYRRDGDWRVHPYPVEPPEVVSGMTGRAVGDLHVMEFAPLRADREEIGLSFGRSPFDDDDAPAMRVPVDRSRTARFDRVLAHEPPAVMIAGLRVRLAAAAAGLVQMTADVVVEADDAAILAVALGAHGFRVHVPTGPGPAALWRDWHPTPDRSAVVHSVEGDGTISVSATASETVTAVQLTPAEAAKLPPPPRHPPDWRAWSTPDSTPLAMFGSHGASGPPPRRPRLASTLQFTAPAPDTQGAVIELTQLWSYRFGGSSVTVPAPAHDRSVPLAGAILATPHGQVELLEWAPIGINGYELTARCTPEDIWPDLRVMAAGSSASLWSSPPHNGIVVAGLPRSHRALFDRPQLEVALRLAGQRVDGPALAAPLVPRPR